ncbi:hypothetical protein M3G91_32440 [Micromonospora chalcea]|uniref:hypothetical protein n=1 Tax=Micromonospora chalcea TaxID=1874 RepID=UPI0021A91DDF|nr:hypothetical protein [Micromonospora chalcea]MCT2282316.1 hypothetical protein [Micromonospora chalcea]
MRRRVAGLWHARGGPLAASVIVVALVIAAAFPELSLSVSTVFDLPPRGVGTPELLAVALASVLPAVTTPRFDGRELNAHFSARLGHLAYSAVFAHAQAGAPDRAAVQGLHGFDGEMVALMPASVTR